MYLSGFGEAVPKRRISQEAAADACVKLMGLVEKKEQRKLRSAFQLTGIKFRHSALLTKDCALEAQYATSQKDASPSTAGRMVRYAECFKLASEAASAALASSGVSASQITDVITVSCTGFFSPGPDIALIKELGIPPTASRSHIGFMGCHGALNALRLARALCLQGRRANVLVCCLEICTLHISSENCSEQIVANALFGDGAAAVIVSDSRLHSSKWKILDCFSALLPDSQNLMKWSIADQGFKMNLSSKVPAVIERYLNRQLSDWLNSQALTTQKIKSWAIHPGGPGILKACTRSLEIAPTSLSVSQEVLSQFGNMSSATILFILSRLYRRDSELPCVAIAFGPGLVCEALLIGD
jgi:predicted naringenin-chalcone synthase